MSVHTLACVYTTQFSPIVLSWSCCCWFYNSFISAQIYISSRQDSLFCEHFLLKCSLAHCLSEPKGTTGQTSIKLKHWAVCGWTPRLWLSGSHFYFLSPVMVLISSCLVTYCVSNIFAWTHICNHKRAFLHIYCTVMKDKYLLVHFEIQITVICSFVLVSIFVSVFECMGLTKMLYSPSGVALSK